MKKNIKGGADQLLYISLATMIVLVIAIDFLSFGSILQKVLILSGASVLLLVATAGKQKVLQALQLVLVAGAVLAFIAIAAIYSLIVMLLIAAAMVFYLYSIGHYKKEPIGTIGSLGFVMFAVGLAFNNGGDPLVVGAAIGFGAIVIVAYSSAAFWLYRVRLQLVWLALNLALSVSPLLLFFSFFGV